MIAWQQIALGFGTALTPSHLAFCLVGTMVGTLIGVLPGLGPVTTIALLLPFTFSMSPTAAVILLAGIYYGAQFGGSVTATLVNIPGEASSTVTCLDGSTEHGRHVEWQNRVGLDQRPGHRHCVWREGRYAAVVVDRVAVAAQLAHAVG